MILEELAEDLVNMTSDLLGGRTINIMDASGIIIASTEKWRIGTFHKGAYDALRSGKMVNILPEEVSLYPGAKEGCNIPLRISGSIIGVVGMNGDPAEIQYLAHLLELYIEKYFQLEAIATPRLAEQESRSRILSALLTPGKESLSKAIVQMKANKIVLNYPSLVIVISNLDKELMTMERTQELLAMLETFVNEKDALWGILHDRFVLIVSEESLEAINSEAERMKQFSEKYRVSISSLVERPEEFPNAYEQALSLNASDCGKNYQDMRNLGDRCHYILIRASDVDRDFLRKKREEVLSIISIAEYFLLLKTAICYFDHNRSVSVAADALFIHKNTLQYRLKRLVNYLNLQFCSNFQQEFYIRLMAEYESIIKVENDLHK